MAGPLTVSGIRFNNPDSGVDVRVARVSVDVALSELFARRVHVLFLDVNGVDVRLSEPKKKEEEPSEFSLEPPIDLVLDKLTLRGARISRDGEELLVVRAADASGRWTTARWHRDPASSSSILRTATCDLPARRPADRRATPVASTARFDGKWRMRSTSAICRQRANSRSSMRRFA